ncbi:hypothetical protein COLO4_01556 [Corchorus olitorius]|uniref:Uncharacterized protein n=1 Tax=Corchorus olitorius TaxID=93759 RepID=A0A1R3L2H1_9ROSI|nr:hypothetical protein COLO4_02593 [Corchorus olitorius]OMP13497.1 hypothetical protein COLO4_01556 [Corchorus olitorius]
MARLNSHSILNARTFRIDEESGRTARRVRSGQIAFLEQCFLNNFSCGRKSTYIEKARRRLTRSL